MQRNLINQTENIELEGGSENKKRQPSIQENPLCLISLRGSVAEPVGSNTVVTDGAANDKLCFQAKLCEVVHHLSPHWPLSLFPSHSPSLLFFLSLFFLIT